MAPQKYPKGETIIPKGELLEHVFLSVLRDASMDLPGIPNWLTAGVQKEPIQIFDINGSILFFDFAVKKGTEILGYVRAGADKVLGFPRIAYEMGPRPWDFDVAVKKLTPRVRKEYPNWKILGNKLVCYSYPKLGVMFEAVNERGEASRLIFDVADFSLIPEKPPRAPVEGAYAWSFYGSLTEDIRKTSLKRFDQFDKWRLEVPESLRKEIRAARTLLGYVEKIKWPSKRRGSKQLQYCTHYDYNEPRSHHSFVLHAQQRNDYCAVATCQMILCYYRYYYSQDQIAPALGYSPGSGCPSDQSPGYKQLSCKHLDATYDSSPTWEKARDQIDALHPLKSGISHHARACAGYSYVWWLFGGITEKKLYIYDPWPWNSDYKLGGTVYWEDWDLITHTNYVFTRLLCP